MLYSHHQVERLEPNTRGGDEFGDLPALRVYLKGRELKWLDAGERISMILEIIKGFTGLQADKQSELLEFIQSLLCETPAA